MIFIHRFAPEVMFPDFRLSLDGRDERYRVHDAYCDDPDCPEHEATVDLTRADGGLNVRVHLDVADGKAHWDADLTPAQAAVAKAFLHVRAVQRAIQRRRQLARAWGLSRQDVDPDERGPAPEGLCRLSDLDPKAEQHVMFFAVRGHLWAAIDQHCVAPACTCMDTTLSFFWEEEGAAAVDPGSSPGSASAPDTRPRR